MGQTMRKFKIYIIKVATEQVDYNLNRNSPTQFTPRKVWKGAIYSRCGKFIARFKIVKSKQIGFKKFKKCGNVPIIIMTITAQKDL